MHQIELTPPPIKTHIRIFYLNGLKLMTKSVRGCTLCVAMPHLLSICIIIIDTHSCYARDVVCHLFLCIPDNINIELEQLLAQLKSKARFKKKPTTPAVPRRSPIQVLGRPNTA